MFLISAIICGILIAIIISWIQARGDIWQYQLFLLREEIVKDKEEK